jgi:hypothetical protein
VGARDRAGSSVPASQRIAEQPGAAHRQQGVAHLLNRCDVDVFQLQQGIDRRLELTPTLIA